MALAGLIYHQFPMAGSNWKRSFLVIFDRCANTNLLDDLFRLGRLGVDVLMSGVGGPLAMAAVFCFVQCVVQIEAESIEFLYRAWQKVYNNLKCEGKGDGQ